MRIDQAIVVRGLAPSREGARALIEAGAVRCSAPGGASRVVARASQRVDEDDHIEVDAAARPRYVSRGGLKLEGALAAADLDVRGKVALDLGQSTGGFTDCLLTAGAARVVGIEVGHGQLAGALRDDARVQCFEGLNVRHLADRAQWSDAFAHAVPTEGFELAVADLSFISLAHAFGPLAQLLAQGGELLTLVKPQFEVGPGVVDSRGVVRDPQHYERVRERIEALAREHTFQPRGWFDSPIRGGDGNREFFFYAIR